MAKFSRLFGILKHKSCKSSRAKSKPMITMKRKNGYLVKVTNKNGDKPPLVGAETFEGYSFMRSDVKNLNDSKIILTVKRKPEDAMIKLAKKGHKSVTFMD